MKKILFLILFVLIFSSCEESNLLDNSGTLTIQTQHLTRLDSGFNYKIWLILDNVDVAVGTFNVNADGTQGQTYFTGIDKADLNEASAIYITIEKTSSVGRSDIVILSGNFSGNSVALSSQNTESVIKNISGKCMRKTPTQNATTNLSGLWFFDNSNAALLNITYNSNFYYRAWLQTTISENVKYLNLGSFEVNNLSDNSSTYCGTDNAIPDFPGEDFIQNPDGLAADFPLNLNNSTLLVELCHNDYSKTSTTPFGFTLLKKTITESITANQIFELDVPIFTATAIRN